MGAQKRSSAAGKWLKAKKPKTMDKDVTRTFQKEVSVTQSSMPRNRLLGSTRKVEFVYTDSFQLDPTVLATGVYRFRANCCYDPNQSGVGHQPRGFDQLMALYDHFVVIGSTINVIAHNTDGVNAQILGIALRDATSGPSLNNDYLEAGNTSTCVLSPASAGGCVGQVSMACNPNKFLGRSSPMSDPELKGSASSSPVEQAYFHVFAAPVNAGIDSGIVTCRVTLRFTTILLEPKLPNES